MRRALGVLMTISISVVFIISWCAQFGIRDTFHGIVITVMIVAVIVMALQLIGGKNNT